MTERPSRERLQQARQWLEKALSRTTGEMCLGILAAEIDALTEENTRLDAGLRALVEISADIEHICNKCGAREQCAADDLATCSDLLYAHYSTLGAAKEKGEGRTTN